MTMLRSRRAAARLALLALVGAPVLVARAQDAALGSWMLAIRGEQTRLGGYYDRRTRIERPGPDRLTVERRHTWLETEPQNGVAVSVTRFARESAWGVAVDVAYGHGSFLGGLETTFGYDTASTPAAGDEQQNWGRSASWVLGGSVARRFGGALDRVNAVLAAGPQLTVLRVELPIGDAVVVPPSQGLPTSSTPRTMRTARYVSPGLAFGGRASVALWRALSLELSATAGMLRADGDAVARDLESVPWPLSGTGPRGDGGAQWRPTSRFGAGISYGRRASR